MWKAYQINTQKNIYNVINVNGNMKKSKNKMHKNHKILTTQKAKYLTKHCHGNIKYFTINLNNELSENANTFFSTIQHFISTSVKILLLYWSHLLNI